MSRPSPEVPTFHGIAMPELYVDIWRRRGDLRHFDLRTRKGQLDFTRWVLKHARADHDLSPEALAPARLSVEREAELASKVAAVQQEAVRTHEKIRLNEASVADLVSTARALLHEAAREMGLEAVVETGDMPDSSGFFRAISNVAKTTATPGFRQPPEGYFDDIEAHGKYVARELNLDYATFLDSNSGRGVRGGLLSRSRVGHVTMLEADALLNACSAMVKLFDLPPA
jgi:hypothetical protein